MVMSWRCCGDVLTKSWRWHSAFWRVYERWTDLIWSIWKVEPHTLWLLNFLVRSWIKKRSLLFCWRLTGRRLKIENAHRSIAIASLMLSFYLRISVRITQTIGDIITSTKPRRCLPKHVGNIVDVLPRYVRDTYNTCIDFFLDVPMPWWSMAITRIRQITGALWRCPGDAQILASQKHREA